MSFPGPDWLGRGVVTRPGGPGLPGVPRVLVDSGSPALALEILGPAWLERRPVVVELALDPAELKQRQSWTGEVYELSPDFEFARERLHFLVWANNYDATRPEPPIWWHERLARRLGAQLSLEAEVFLEGQHLWCDGGPRGGLEVPVLHRESIEGQSLRLTRPGQRQGLELAPDQLAAVLHPAGAARIIAPAGSGKTRVLTERLRHLLVDRGYERERVTALAYNRRAAEEMRARTRDFRPQVQTLHALGYSLLGRPRLLEEREVRAILRPMLNLPPVLGQDPLAPYLEALGEIRLGLRRPEQVEARRRDVEGLARVFPRYRERLRRENAVDHDEQIYGALELLLADPEARRRAQRGCTHLLVDEFQDLTPAYLLLVRLLAGPAGQVFGVGDDDQVIYGYAGADPGFLIDFARFFPGARSYALEVNYRCPVGVVEAAGALLARNRRRLPKTIRPGPDALAGTPEVLKVPSADWAAHAVRLLQGWLQEVEPDQVAVLSRTQACLMPVQVYLAEAGVAYFSLVDPRVLQRTGLRTALAYLRLAAQPEALRSEDLAEALRRPGRKLKRELVEAASQCRSTRGLLAYARRQEPWPAQQLEEFAGHLALLGRRLAQGVPAALAALREQVGLGTAMEELDREAADSHLDDLLALEQTARLHPEPTGFEEWLRERLAQPERGGVRLSTVHRVKGMEWDRVLVFGAQQGLWPHRLAEDAEEERRVFHVALTRGRRQVTVLACSERPSPFVKELRAPKLRAASGAGAGLEALAGRLGVPPDHLAEAVEQLKGQERAVFLALYQGGEARAALARRLGQTPSLVRTWQQLAERLVRERLRRLGHLELGPF